MSSRKKRTISDIIDAYFEDIERWAEEFEETMMQRPSWNLKNCTIEPLREIMVTPAEVVVTVDLPYTDKKAIRVKPMSSTSLEVSARLKKKIHLDDFGMTHCRGEFKKFHCHVRIPVPVQTKEMTLHFKRGILEIRLPRK